jgi:hypothetical protein
MGKAPRGNRSNANQAEIAYQLGAGNFAPAAAPAASSALTPEEQGKRLNAIWQAGVPLADSTVDLTALTPEQTAYLQKLEEDAHSHLPGISGPATRELIALGLHQPAGDTNDLEADANFLDTSAPRRLDSVSRNHANSPDGGYKGKAHAGRLLRDNRIVGLIEEEASQIAAGKLEM